MRYSQSLVALLASALTGIASLCLFNGWINPILYVFEVLGVFAVSFIILRQPKAITFKYSNEIFPFFDLIVVAISFVVFLAQLGSQPSILLMMLATIVSTLFPGYAVLRLANFVKHFSLLEGIVLSFVFSFPVTAFLIIIGEYFVPFAWRALFTSGAYTMLMLAALFAGFFRNRGRASAMKLKSIEVSDLIALCV